MARGVCSVQPDFLWRRRGRRERSWEAKGLNAEGMKIVYMIGKSENGKGKRKSSGREL